jgi:diguanylate cyclase (GGDEF)-like protein
LQRSNLQIRQQAAQLQELSIRDALTGLYNRRHFDEQGTHLLLEARRYGRPLSVMIGDIDFFKKINDHFSHATGDEVLRRISDLLQENTRGSDVLARYGGEEFVILFPQTPQPAACALCEKLRSLIETYPWWEVDEELHVTMSMGVAGDQAGDSFEKLLVVADAQLYQAKANGRNRVNCTASALGLSPDSASSSLNNFSHGALCDNLSSGVTLEAPEK